MRSPRLPRLMMFWGWLGGVQFKCQTVYGGLVFNRYERLRTVVARWLGVGVVLGANFFVTASARGQSSSGPVLLVTSPTRISGAARLSGGTLRVWGRVTDDSGAGVEGARLRFRVEGRREVTERGFQWKRCSGHDGDAGREQWASCWETDADGRFCCQDADVGTGVSAVEVRVLSTGVVEGGRKKLSMSRGDVGQPRIDLGPTLGWRYDQPEATVTGSIVNSAVGGGGLVASVEGKSSVATTVRADGRFVLKLPLGERLAPGNHELVVFYVSKETGVVAAETRRLIALEATVSMRAQPMRIDANEVIVAVDVNTGSWSVTSGVVLLEFGEVVVAKGKVNNGTGNMVVSLAEWERAEAKGREIRVRYLPSEPYLRPGPSLRMSLQTGVPRGWLRVSLVVVAAVLALWMAVGWRRPERGKRRPQVRWVPGASRVVSRVYAAVNSVRRGGDGSVAGKVVDAHEQQPVRQAVVRVVRVSFSKRQVVAECKTGTTGTFSFDAHLPAGAGLMLEVTADGYESWVQPLSRRKDTIGLVTLRRKALEKLVSWAQQRGGKWFPGREPVPAEIVRLARATVPVDETALDLGIRTQHRAYGPPGAQSGAEKDLSERAPRGVSALTSGATYHTTQQPPVARGQEGNDRWP